MDDRRVGPGHAVSQHDEAPAALLTTGCAKWNGGIAVVNGEIFARAIIRSRMLKRAGGTVSHDEFFAAVGRPDDTPDVSSWIHDWAAASALPPTKAEAPSIWA